MIKANFIALGQAGGNVGKLLEERGLKGVYINSSQEDLDTLEVENKYCIPGADGCNKNRNKAKKYVEKDIKNILAKVSKTLDSDIVFVIGSAGGGTGSGALPVVSNVIANHLNKIVCAVTILPAETESVQAHINTYEVIKELSHVDKLGAMFLIDNNKDEKKLVLNKKFTDLIYTLLNITEHKSVEGNIDTAELKNFLKTKGLCVMAEEKKINDKSKVSDDLFDRLKTSDVFVDIENDKAVTYGIISTNSEINEVDIVSRFGTPRDVYKNTQDKFDFVALAGLSLPLQRLQEVINRLNKDKDEVIKNQQTVQDSFKIFDDVDDFGFNNDFSIEENVTETKEQEFDFNSLGNVFDFLK